MNTRWIILFALSIATACADDATGPRVPADPPWELGAVPLALGNCWSYDLSFDISWTNMDGTVERPSEHFDGSGVREIAHVDTIDGREYFVENFTAATDGGPFATEWRRYRQTDDAFYQADIRPSVPPDEIPPDLIVGDQVRLRFPVTVGDTWRLRPGSDFAVLTVAARDTLKLSIGDTPCWRVSLHIAIAGPADYVYLWYNGRGLMKREAHTEIYAENPGSGQIVHIVTHEVDELVGLELVGP